MTEIRIEGRDRSVFIPSSWEEMNGRQVRHIFRLFHKCVRENLSPLEFNIRALYYFLKVRRGRKKCDSVLAERVYLLTEQCTGFLLDDSGAAPRLSFRSITNPMPSMGLRRGPGELCQSLTFGEFRHAAMAVKSLPTTKDRGNVDECVALLYRLPLGRCNKAGRRCTSPGGIFFRFELWLMRRMPQWRKHLAFSWFCNVLSYLQSGTVIIDGEEVDMRQLFSSGSSSSSGPACGWNDLLIQLAKDGTIGNIDAVDAEPLMSIFQIMWSNYKEFKRYEASSKTGKSH